MFSTPENLQQEAACWACSGATTQAQLYRLALLSRIARLLAPVNTDTQSLMDHAKCVVCSGALSQAEAMEIALLDMVYGLIASGGIGGGVICGNYGGGNPTFVPASGCGVAIDTSNDRIWWYYNGTWN
jgi:hypothetical protein